MAKKRKDYSKEILERIVGTKKKTDLAEKFKEAFVALQLILKKSPNNKEVKAGIFKIA